MFFLECLPFLQCAHAVCRLPLAQLMLLKTSPFSVFFISARVGALTFNILGIAFGLAVLSVGLFMWIMGILSNLSRAYTSSCYPSCSDPLRRCNTTLLDHSNQRLLRVWDHKLVRARFGHRQTVAAVPIWARTAIDLLERNILTAHFCLFARL